MRIVAIVGFSETGKTRLAVRLIEEIRRRGLRIAALKRCSHGFDLDTEGKDSAAFSRAGAEGVAMVSPEGWAALGPGAPADPAGLARRFFPGVDVVLVEGGKDTRGLRKIEVLRAGVSEVPVSPPGDLAAIVTDGPRPPGAAVPVFGPDDAAAIADLILSFEEGDMTKITLEVDGREILLNAFVQSFIEKTVLGMVTALSGVDPEPKRVTLVIERGGAAPAGGARS